MSDNFSKTPLPLNWKKQLHRIDDFYICSHFTEEFIGPQMIIIKGKAYYRFMKFIYLPQPPEELNIEQVIKICDLRLDYLDKLVNVEFNNFAIEIMANCIKLTLTSMNSRLKALDFGCGSGLSSQLLLKYFPELDITGVDVSPKAIHFCQKQRLSAILLSPSEPFPFETASFDLIIAAFVMHFKIAKSELVELYRILRPTGKFVFNIYQRNIDGIIRQLDDVGFNPVEIWENVYVTGVNYAIVSCGKSINKGYLRLLRGDK